MVYGEPHRHARCDVLGISYFLKVGSNSNGKIKKDVIQNVKQRQDNFRLHHGVGEENKYEAAVLEGKYFSLAEADNALADQWTQKVVDQVIYDKKSCNLLNTKIKLLDQKENSKGYKDLAPRSPHKGKEIKQPIFLAQWN